MTRRVVLFEARETGTRLLSGLREHAPDVSFAGFADEVSIEQTGELFCTLPPADEIDETIRLDLQLRAVRIEDLYRKPWPALSPDPVAPMLRGRVVMVTGAGGSIGSALCRAMARYEPAAIVAFDISEAGLFHLDREMARRFPGVAFYSEIGSIQNRTRCGRLLRKYRPDLVYHAAAYKHVPMLERHLVEAVRNNVIATWDLASLSAEHGVDRFILVSTDKAVRARNVLGLTKRTAEAAVEAVAQTGLPYFAVRLGNVLGSSGSVSRVFQMQIEQRLPLSLTDPRMTRYVTTLTEASHFLLDASALGAGGAIYALEMGDPVSIGALARRMIALNGLAPEVDIPIVITGRRAGEELTEELFHPGEIAAACGHPRVRRIDRIDPTSQAAPLPRMEAAMQSMRELCETDRADRLREAMDEICFAGAAS